MATATGLTIVKRFPYRGNADEEFSNTYWFKPVTPPADAAAWRTLFDAVVALEKPIYPGAGPSTTNVIRGYGYDDDTGHKPGDEGAVAPTVWSVDLTAAGESVVPGTLVTSGGNPMPGDDAVWVRWTTERRTSPGGKPIYIRKYFHPAYNATGTSDGILGSQQTALLALGAGLSSGALVGGRTITTAGRLDTILGHAASTYVTTRTLKRRGRRP